MYNFLFMAHSGWRWIVLALLIIAPLKMLIGWVGKQQWSRLDQILVRAAAISVHIQIGLGIILYGLYIWLIGYGVGPLTAGHVLPALLAFAGATYSSIQAKRKSTPTGKFKHAFIGFAAGLLMAYGAIAYATAN